MSALLLWVATIGLAAFLSTVLLGPERFLLAALLFTAWLAHRVLLA